MTKKQTFIDKLIKIVSHQKDKTPLDLKKYQILIVGSNIGGALTKNLTHFTHGHKTIFCAFDSPKVLLYPMRTHYELKKIKDLKYNIGSL